MAVETPQGILFGRAIILLRKVYLSLIETKPRRSKRIEQAVAGDPIQRRYVPRDAGGNEVFVRGTNGNLNEALPKGLQQRLVSGIVAIVTRRTAGNQKGSQGEGGGRHEWWAAGNHPAIMPPLAVCGAGPKLARQIGRTAAGGFIRSRNRTDSGSGSSIPERDQSAHVSTPVGIRAIRARSRLPPRPAPTQVPPSPAEHSAFPPGATANAARIRAASARCKPELCRQRSVGRAS
jgi:hypothetical protein